MTTGDVGVTAAEVTREAVAAVTDRARWCFSEELIRQIEAYFVSRGFRRSPSNRRQAFSSAGVSAIENSAGR